MVQTSAAYALRMVLSRRQDAAPAGRKLLIAALKSPDARTRWGATRLFNQHFKDLTGDADLLAALESDLNDPGSLRSFSSRLRLVALVLLAGGPTAGAPEHSRSVGHPPQHRDRIRWCAAAFRRASTICSMRIPATWKPGCEPAPQDEDKNRIGDGYEAVVRDQAQVLAKVLREGTPLGREGILNALWDFHIRHYALPPLKADTVSIGLPAVLTKYVTGVPDLHRPGL